ncbi:pre T-cell antigen receptor alpha isoform 2 precursor [Sus scrofa]|uniref:pre T-cell antigen receptor alpha isoform 2 precursor n=1 Tax=Sus scrofa TaxID=9823 RepID=UPI00004F706E|nr:pre T-cell antigen receptor alpha isoform 2 precursor [Sus scrofa]BAD93326.1 pre T cell receptor alpha chain splicing variant 3 [Sus scrofa]
MAKTWLLLLLALECPALPTDPLSSPSSPEVTSLLRLAQQGVGSTPFPSLAPPITLLVEGKQQTLVVCLVLDVAPPGLESTIWFSAGNGSFLDAFTYGPSPAADGSWTSVAQLSVPSEELAAWETLVCHTGPGPGNPSQSTQPLQLSGGDGAWAHVDAPCPFHTPWNQDMVGGRADSRPWGHEGCPSAILLGEVMPGLRAGWPQGPESWDLQLGCVIQVQALMQGFKR